MPRAGDEIGEGGQKPATIEDAPAVIDDIDALAAGIQARDASTLVLTMPDSGPRISAAMANGVLTTTIDCPDLDTAVLEAFSWARSDGVVLLSPAAPSFGLFKDYRDRAEAFAREVRALT